MPGTINRRASVHTSNEDGVSIEGTINLPESVWTPKPDSKKLGYRRRASLAHVDVTAPLVAPLKRRTSLSCSNQEILLIQPPATTGQTQSNSESNAPARLPKLPTPPPSPIPGRLRSGLRREITPPALKMAVGKARSPLKPPSRSPSPTELRSQSSLSKSGATNQDLGGADTEENGTREVGGWAMQNSVKKRMSRLQQVTGPGVFKKEMPPRPSRQESGKPLSRQLIAPEKTQAADIQTGNQEALGPGEDLSQNPEYEPPMPESLKKTFSQPSLLLSQTLPNRDQLTSLEMTLARLKEELSSEPFRKSYQKMIERPRSARSSRILNMFPDYVQQQNEEIFAQRRLIKTRLEIRDTLQKSHKTMEISSALLLNHFKGARNEDLSSYIACFFDAYDINKNGTLEPFEVRKALQDLGKACNENDVKEFFEKAGASGNSIDRANFETMVRSMQGWDALSAATTPLKAVRKMPALAKTPSGRVVPLFKARAVEIDTN